MKTKTILLVATALSLIIALVHIFAGQFDLVNPLLESAITDQQKTEWLAVWHIITMLLFWMTFQLFQQSKKTLHNLELLKSLLGLNYLIALVFIGASLWMKMFAPQWIAFLLLGILIHFAIQKIKKSLT